MRDLLLGLRLLARMLRAGELNLLAIALALAVGSMATVALFTDRTRLALEQESNRLLGADLVLTSSRPIDAALVRLAAEQGLKTTATLSFRSMIVRGEANQLAEITAVQKGYPLRGASRIASGRGEDDKVAPSVPARGTLWGDERLVGQLGIAVGDALKVGNASLTMAALLTQDPSLTLSVLGLGPRIIMSQADVEATGLITTGSRATYRLLLAGEKDRIAAYRARIERRAEPGIRIEGVRDARPEVRSALERADRFMGLAALTAVALATVAVMLAGRRFHERQLDACAMLRCLGCGQWRLFRLQLTQLLGVGVAASVAGSMLGYAGQWVLGQWLSSAVEIALPAPGVMAAVRASALGLLLLLAFGLPPLLSLRRVPALRVLRRDIGAPAVASLFAYGAGAIAVGTLVLWHAGDTRLGAYVLVGFVVTLAVAAAVTWIGLRVLANVPSTGVSWRYGMASLERRPLTTVWQVVALSLGLAAILTLTLIRSDLLRAWEGNLPADAPNRFLVNIQPDQIGELQAFLRERLGKSPTFYPMIRGRLVAINEVPVDPANSARFPDDRARRLVEREFNLSWTGDLPAHNRLVGGVWQGEGAALSVEDGIARTLGIALGDRLTYDVAGERFTAAVTSLRKVEWDSFRVNFFVIGTAELLREQPTTYVTSFHLPARSASAMNELVQRFPTVVVVDVVQLVTQVQAMIGQVSRAVSFIFIFTLAAGLLVLYAGIDATHDERAREVAVMRTLGATRRQVVRAHAAEFGIIGALAGLLAACAAAGLGYAVATRLLGLALAPDPWLWVFGLAFGTCGVLAAGLLFTRRVLATPPLASLRQLD